MEAKIAFLKEREKRFRDVLLSGSSSPQSLLEARFEVDTLPVQISEAEQRLASLKARRSSRNSLSTLRGAVPLPEKTPTPCFLH